jgi:hypothetical protein
VSLFIRAPDFGFLKPLHRATQFLRFGRARIIHDTNVIGDHVLGDEGVIALFL